MDLKAVRAFVAIADSGQFQKAAVDLALTQQAVSKRIAALEKDLGVRLLVRTPRGAELTIDGQALLPHARALLQAEDRAVAAVRPGDRALRVDVVGRRAATAGLVRDFHRAHPEVTLDVVTLFGVDAAVAAVRAEWVTPAQLAGHRIWMPGNEPGTEWAAYYDELAATFGPAIDTIGPNFGVEALLDAVAGSPALATFLSERTPLVWPTGHDLRLVPLRDPTPVYPHSLLWRTDNSHPGLTALRAHLAAQARLTEGETWRPSWAAPAVSR